MNRRTILRNLCGMAASGLAGCQTSDSDGSAPHSPSSTSPETTHSPTKSAASSTESEQTETGPRTYHVAPEGRDANPGSEDGPLATIQAGLEKAQPGDTIQVAPGEYHEAIEAGHAIETVRDGDPDSPITITGSEEAILYASWDDAALRINHSHIHLRGLTVDGLLDSSKPDEPESYSDLMLIHTIPPTTQSQIEDIVCAPKAIGNSRKPLMLFERTKYLEVGPLRVMGLAGADYVLGDRETHVGEIIYLGQPLFEEPEGYPWDTIDYTSHVHVHHVDNSEGHPHSELVNAKIGTHDVLVEYCSSHGGAQNNDREPNAEVRFESSDATLRWCDLRNGSDLGIHVWGDGNDPISEERDPERISERVGDDHSIYGNRFENFANAAMRIDAALSEQQIVCGNEINGPPGNAPESPCPTDIPEGDGIGHLGGDSPWS